MRVAASHVDIYAGHRHEVDEHLLEAPEQLYLVEEHVALASTCHAEPVLDPLIELVWVAQHGAGETIEGELDDAFGSDSGFDEAPFEHLEEQVGLAAAAHARDHLHEAVALLRLELLHVSGAPYLHI